MLDAILNPDFAALAGGIFALATPLAGVAVFLWRKEDREALKGTPLFWALSASGPFLICLWFLFNAVENHFGLDSLVGTLLNLALFGLIGAGIGATFRYGSTRSGPAQDTEAAQDSGKSSQK